MLTEKDVLNAREIYLSEDDVIVLLKGTTGTAYRFTKESLSWEVIKRWYSRGIHCKTLSGKDAIEVMDKWRKEKDAQSEKLNRAIEFATKKHSGQFRKGTTIPYIVHPLEVLSILYSMRAETNVMIAGVLHDTVEDTDTTLDEIREIFGDEVAVLVAANSEDKAKSWDERKKHTIYELANAGANAKMLIMADKLSNMRSIAFDYNHIGNRLWERFNAPKEKQAWYYDGIIDALYDMQFVPECENAYWEFLGLFKDVFVKYYLDETDQKLYQASDCSDVYLLEKGNPQWTDIYSPPCPFSAEVFERCTLIPRKEAELLEDIWNRPFRDCHKKDVEDGEYKLFSSKKRDVRVQIWDCRLSLMCEDYGKECRSINGSDEYEFSYTLDEENTRRFLSQLRIEHGTDKSLEHILKENFGKDEGPEMFKKFCDEKDVHTVFYSR